MGLSSCVGISASWKESSPAGPYIHHYEETHYGKYNEHEHHRRCTHVTETGSTYRKPDVGGDGEYGYDGNHWGFYHDAYDRN